MLLDEEIRRSDKGQTFHIFATDIDENAIKHARRGVYSDAIRTDVSPARLSNYFDQDRTGYRVSKVLREHVVFAVHNILRDPPFSRLDLVSCRNLLIYLDRRVQQE